MELYCNDKERKLGSEGMRRHKEDRERSKEVRERGRRED